MKNIFILLLLYLSCSNSTHKTVKTESYESFKKNIDFKNDTIKKPTTDTQFIKRDSIYKFLALIKDTVLPPKNCKPFDTLKFNKAVAYEFDGRREKFFVFKNKSQTVIRQTALKQKEVNNLCKLFSSKSSYGGITAACFEPHLCICFFQNNKCVMEISICLSCNYLDTTIEIPATKSFPVKYDDHTSYRIGFNKIAQKKLKSFCSTLGYNTYDFQF